MLGLEEKVFRTFSQVMREITPSRYIGAILKKLVVFLRRVELFAFNWDEARKKNIFGVWEALL